MATLLIQFCDHGRVEMRNQNNRPLTVVRRRALVLVAIVFWSSLKTSVLRIEPIPLLTMSDFVDNEAEVSDKEASSSDSEEELPKKSKVKKSAKSKRHIDSSEEEDDDEGE